MKMKLNLTLLLVVFGMSVCIAQQYPDRHSTDLADDWMSCEISASPNTARGDSHWIMYDFGNTYALEQSTFWNVNGYEETNNGLREIIVDYSIDGNTWIELALHTLQEAPSSSFYQGELGPEFGGVVARYVLITGLSNYGADCYGLSEVRFQSTVSTDTNTDNLTFVDSHLLAAPNPMTNHTQISINGLQSGIYHYDIIDVTGKIVIDGYVNVASNEKLLNLNVTQLVQGTYLFRLNYGSLVLSQQLQVIN